MLMPRSLRVILKIHVSQVADCSTLTVSEAMPSMCSLSCGVQVKDMPMPAAGTI